MNLIEKIRKAREVSAEIGGYKLTLRRPTDIEAMSMTYKSNIEAIEGVSKFVVNWHGVTELDLIPGGSAVEVPFDQELFAEWIMDKPNLWAPLVNKIKAIYDQHTKAREDAAKN